MRTLSRLLKLQLLVDSAMFSGAAVLSQLLSYSSFILVGAEHVAASCKLPFNNLWRRSSLTDHSDSITRESAYQKLLTDFFDEAKRDLNALIATAIRTRSMFLRMVVERGAVKPSLSSARLKEKIFSGELYESDVADSYLLGELGRLILVQGLLPDDGEYGEQMLRRAHGLGDPDALSSRARRVLIQRYIANGNFLRAENLLDASPDVDSQFFGYLRAEMWNPFTSGSSSRFDDWLASFNRAFYHHKVAPVSLHSQSKLRPFDRLTTTATNYDARGAGSTLVSVVLTAFRPDAERLWTSVRSITSQTWTNLELIIVNDCSGPEFDEVFERIAITDSRIRLINLAENRGTYAARNVGYAASRGNFIAGQDDDDWSHPQRIEKQVAYMEDHSDAIGCRVTAMRCDENLVRVRVGFSPFGQNASSLLIRREGYEQVGGFVEARKAADTEFYLRLMKVTGRAITDLKAPLSIIRLLGGSLSRADFSPGWKHSSRRSFRSAYEYWHRSSTRQELHLVEDSLPRVAVPKRFQIASQDDPQQCDVVLVADWEVSSGYQQTTILEEVRALVHSGYRVGILNLESGRRLRTADQVSLGDGIQRLINCGSVHEVFYDDVVSAHSLIVRDPRILHFLPHGGSLITARNMHIVASEAPSHPQGKNIHYLPGVVHTDAEEAFGVQPTWWVSDESLRDILEPYLGSELVQDAVWPTLIDIENRWHNRAYYRSMTPVVGRFSSELSTDWPKARDTVEKIYPTDGRYDIRILGPSQKVLKVLGLNRPPTGWTFYENTEIQRNNFAYTLDYYVYFPQEKIIKVPYQEILAVLATGTIVILPKELEKAFGDAAIYGTPGEVSDIVTHLHSDFSNYKDRLERTRMVLLQDFSYKSFVNRVKPFIEQL